MGRWVVWGTWNAALEADQRSHQVRAKRTVSGRRPPGSGERRPRSRARNTSKRSSRCPSRFHRSRRSNWTSSSPRYNRQDPGRERNDLRERVRPHLDFLDHRVGCQPASKKSGMSNAGHPASQDPALPERRCCARSADDGVPDRLGGCLRDPPGRAGSVHRCCGLPPRRESVLGGEPGPTLPTSPIHSSTTFRSPAGGHLLAERSLDPYIHRRRGHPIDHTRVSPRPTGYSAGSAESSGGSERTIERSAIGAPKRIRQAGPRPSKRPRALIREPHRCRPRERDRRAVTTIPTTQACNQPPKRRVSSRRHGACPPASCSRGSRTASATPDE